MPCNRQEKLGNAEYFLFKEKNYWSKKKAPLLTRERETIYFIVKWKNGPKLYNLNCVAINMYSILVIFKLGLLDYNHALIFCRSHLALVKSSEVDLDEALSGISSAYIRAFVYCRHVGRSLIYI